MKILLNKNTTEVFNPKKLLPNALANSRISSNKPHKRGIILFAMTLLLFLLTANGVQAQPPEWNCPGKIPGQINDWEPFTALEEHPFPAWRRVKFGNCWFEFKLCIRELDVQPVPKPNPPLWEYFVCEIRIPDIPENEDCDVDDLDIIRNFNAIVEAYIPIFARWLVGQARLVMGPCSGDMYDGNIVRIGRPTCVTDPYWFTEFSSIPTKSHRTITHCVKYFPPLICWDIYEYCFDHEGRAVLLKKEDGSASIPGCPLEKKVKMDDILYPDPDLGYVTVACHKVCGSGQQTSPTSVVETVIISSVSPNPTSNGTTLTLEVLTAGSLNIKLVNVEGQELMELHNAHTEAGEFTRNFTMSNLPQGVYYLRISHNGNVKMEKVIRN